MKLKLTKIEMEGFRSIGRRKGQIIPLGDITVLLGANGSGKSNLVSFFKMLNYMTTKALQKYVGKHGVRQLLHYGPKITESIEFTLHFCSDNAEDTYYVKLSHGLPDRLFVSGERVTYQDQSHPQPQEFFLEGNGAETALGNDDNPETYKTSRVIQGILSGIRAYQFHDTSDTARIKDRHYVDDAQYLRSDGGNLASFLKRLKENNGYRVYYEKIVRAIRSIMPQFGDFSLDTVSENKNYVRLNWVDSTGSDYLFGPDQIADGSLRFMALTTLLLQPPDLCPGFIVLDEPELGLHPTAISKLAGMIRSLSKRGGVQILLATQSPRLVDEFSLEELLIVEWNGADNASEFKKLEAARLQVWLERYSLSEIWEKNILGGQP